MKMCGISFKDFGKKTQELERRRKKLSLIKIKNPALGPDFKTLD